MPQAFDVAPFGRKIQITKKHLRPLAIKSTARFLRRSRKTTCALYSNCSTKRYWGRDIMMRCWNGRDFSYRASRRKRKFQPSRIFGRSRSWPTDKSGLSFHLFYCCVKCRIRYRCRCMASANTAKWRTSHQTSGGCCENSTRGSFPHAWPVRTRRRPSIPCVHKTYWQASCTESAHLTWQPKCLHCQENSLWGRSAASPFLCKKEEDREARATSKLGTQSWLNSSTTSRPLQSKMSWQSASRRRKVRWQRRMFFWQSPCGRTTSTFSPRRQWLCRESCGSQQKGWSAWGSRGSRSLWRLSSTRLPRSFGTCHRSFVKSQRRRTPTIRTPKCSSRYARKWSFSESRSPTMDWQRQLWLPDLQNSSTCGKSDVNRSATEGLADINGISPTSCDCCAVHYGVKAIGQMQQRKTSEGLTSLTDTVNASFSAHRELPPCRSSTLSGRKMLGPPTTAKGTGFAQPLSRQCSPSTGGSAMRRVPLRGIIATNRLRHTSWLGVTDWWRSVQATSKASGQPIPREYVHKSRGNFLPIDYLLEKHYGEFWMSKVMDRQLWKSDEAEFLKWALSFITGAHDPPTMVNHNGCFDAETDAISLFTQFPKYACTAMVPRLPRGSLVSKASSIDRYLQSFIGVADPPQVPSLSLSRPPTLHTFGDNAAVVSQVQGTSQCLDLFARPLVADSVNMLHSMLAAGAYRQSVFELPRWLPRKFNTLSDHFVS